MAPVKYVNVIKAVIASGNKKKVCLECRKAIINLSKCLKRAKTIGEKAHITECMAQIKTLRSNFMNVGDSNSKKLSMRVRWNSLESAFQSRIQTGVVINLSHKDLNTFLSDCLTIFIRRVYIALKQFPAIKVNTVLSGEFQITKANETLEDLKYINTPNASIYQNTDLNLWFKTHVQDPLIVELSSFASENSGWALKNIVNLMVCINKYNPLRAGSYIDLPAQIKRKKACVNVQNDDDRCFAWAVVSALYIAPSKIAELCQSYPDPAKVFNLKGIQFPITLGQAPRFEKQNNISINIYKLDNSKKSLFVVPHYLTENKRERHVNLLLIQDKYIDNDMADLTPPKFHYVLIKNLSRLLSRQLSKKKQQKFICDRCLHYFYSSEKLNSHLIDCKKLNHCVIPKLPTPENSILKFTNYSQKKTVPFVIYSDIECLLSPITSDVAHNTTKYQEHVPFTIGYYVKCAYDDSLSFYKQYTGPDCMQWFVNQLHDFAEDVETVFLCDLPMDALTFEQQNEFNTATHCHICEGLFLENEKRVRDHSHLMPGKYNGPAHESCNLNFNDNHTIPIVFHNLSCYDGHLIIKALAETEGAVDVLPVNKEKYISFTKHIPDNLVKFRFIDSFRFMAAGLDKLASYLNEYPILKSQFNHLSDEQFGLICRKGFYPYDYMSDWGKLKETVLPSQSAFYNRLEDRHISSINYAHAQKVWTAFNCKSLQEYSDIYLKTDILLLADVFEQFINTSHKTYGLSPAHSYTLPGYAWQCMLYMCRQQLELLTDLDMILFIEKGIRGGLSQCSKRYAEANNKYMSNYNTSKPTSYLMYFDVNNQYGWAMSQYLSYGEFKWLTTDDVLKLNISEIADNSPDGYILEVDLDIPRELHDKFSDLPPCPEHDIPINSTNKKLLATLHNKNKHIIHYRNLKQALELGVKLTKIHRALSFKQSAWLKQYIDFNTQLRQGAKNDFEKNLFKLMNNAVFGKTMENIRNHSSVKLITKWDGRYGAEALIARPEFRSAIIINENMVIVELAKSNVYFNKPIYVGMCILDLAKTTIYEFHYNYMAKRFDSKLLYTDTDSLIYEINNNEVYEVMKHDCDRYFDTSDYKSDNTYGIPLVNKKVLGMMKDENNGRIMTHFVGLRSKMYATKLLYTPEEIEKERKKLEQEQKDGCEIARDILNLGVTKKIKGIKQSVIKTKITFDDYVECLETWIEKAISQNTIRSFKHELFSINQKKIGLSPHDDKRQVNKRSVDTLPYGHCSLMEHQ